MILQIIFPQAVHRQFGSFHPPTKSCVGISPARKWIPCCLSRRRLSNQKYIPKDKIIKTLTLRNTTLTISAGRYFGAVLLLNDKQDGIPPQLEDPTRNRTVAARWLSSVTILVCKLWKIQLGTNLHTRAGNMPNTPRPYASTCPRQLGD